MGLGIFSMVYLFFLIIVVKRNYLLIKLKLPNIKVNSQFSGIWDNKQLSDNESESKLISNSLTPINQRIKVMKDIETNTEDMKLGSNFSNINTSKNNIQCKFYRIVACVYMTRYLIAGDSNGLSDPYCRITINGETRETSIKNKMIEEDIPVCGMYNVKKSVKQKFNEDEFKENNPELYNTYIETVETYTLNDSNNNINSSALTPLKAILEVLGILFSTSPYNMTSSIFLFISSSI